jgi:hypothetical protein
MEPQEPKPNDGPEQQPGGADDALRRLEQRLDRASDAAERLLAEAAGSAARAARVAADAAAGAAGSAADSLAGQTPPAGWQVPGGGSDAGSRADMELLAQVMQSLRELIPPELQRRIAEALRELLLAIRALIDWYLERVERTRAEPAEIQDIPIA